jgi:hypothetical protein
VIGHEPGPDQCDVCFEDGAMTEAGYCDVYVRTRSAARDAPVASCGATPQPGPIPATMPTTKAETR